MKYSIGIRKKCLIIQPGAYGDIILCAPIAKHYKDLDYEVFWPVRREFFNLVSGLGYVNPIIINEDTLHEDWLRSDVMKILPIISQYDLVINLADRGPHQTSQLHYENFEQCKYRLANVNINEKHKLVWSRDYKKEDFIYNKFVSHKDYIFVHNSSSHNEVVSYPDFNLPVVKFEVIKDYTIFDWYKAIINAKNILCTESSIWAFVDGIINELRSTPYLLSRNGLINKRKYTLSNNWSTEYLL